jgi:2-(1,2-epoxy-1,2-dihydrophenyl)acetyl-CoA isomerase
MPRGEPERLNMLSAPSMRKLQHALDALGADTDIHSVVSTGADPGFNAGSDLKMMELHTVAARRRRRRGPGATSR